MLTTPTVIASAKAAREATVKNEGSNVRLLTYIITNVSAATVTLCLTVNDVLIAPKNVALASGESLTASALPVNYGAVIQLKASGNIDYYIVIQ